MLLVLFLSVFNFAMPQVILPVIYKDGSFDLVGSSVKITHCYPANGQPICEGLKRQHFGKRSFAAWIWPPRAMVFGSTIREQILLNEESLWCGSNVAPNPFVEPGNLKEVQMVILDIEEATEPANKFFMSKLALLRSYQPIGDLYRLSNENRSPKG
jgi:hypothetical protein